MSEYISGNSEGGEVCNSASIEKYNAIFRKPTSDELDGIVLTQSDYKKLTAPEEENISNDLVQNHSLDNIQQNCTSSVQEELKPPGTVKIPRVRNQHCKRQPKNSTDTMTSVGTIHLCPACNTSYIMGYDLHAICEACLGSDHANLALTPQSTCPSCRHLPPEEKQRQLAILSPQEGEFPVADQCSLDEALGIFDAGRESDNSAPETATDISTPFLQTEDAEAGVKSVQIQGFPMSATTPLPAMGALVSALLDIIAKVANAKGVPVPAPLAQHLTDDLARKFAPAHPTPHSTPSCEPG
ncbi:hypothetical protein AMECASPLE_029622 [Ameca splendens]|uniref:Uncharacterized protein n=1 Tax=Ameca splendens TaxID=208324 RepID=A0ABV0Y5N9_9TELE